MAFIAVSLDKKMKKKSPLLGEQPEARPWGCIPAGKFVRFLSTIMGNHPFPSSDVLPRDLRVLLVLEETPTPWISVSSSAQQGLCPLLALEIRHTAVSAAGWEQVTVGPLGGSHGFSMDWVFNKGFQPFLGDPGHPLLLAVCSPGSFWLHRNKSVHKKMQHTSTSRHPSLFTAGLPVCSLLPQLAKASRRAFLGGGCRGWR